MVATAQVRRSSPTYLVLLLVLLLQGITACATQPQRDDWLYQSLGGQVGIERLVNRFLHRVADDERIVHYFYGIDISRLEQKFAEYLAMVAGGPEPYLGEQPGFVHRGYHITEAAFNAVVEDLLDAMAELGIPLAARNELIARLAPLQPHILGTDP